MYNILHSTCNVLHRTLHIFQHGYICKGWHRVFKFYITKFTDSPFFVFFFVGGWVGEVDGWEGTTIDPYKINILQHEFLSMLNHHMQATLIFHNINHWQLLLSQRDYLSEKNNDHLFLCALNTSDMTTHVITHTNHHSTSCKATQLKRNKLHWQSSQKSIW